MEVTPVDSKTGEDLKKQYQGHNGFRGIWLSLTYAAEFEHVEDGITYPRVLYDEDPYPRFEGIGLRDRTRLLRSIANRFCRTTAAAG